MKVTYDPSRDELRILFSNAPIARSLEKGPGLILDFDSRGRIVGLEMARASEQMYNPRSVEYREHTPLPDGKDAPPGTPPTDPPVTPGGSHAG